MLKILTLFLFVTFSRFPSQVIVEKSPYDNIYSNEQKQIVEKWNNYLNSITRDKADCSSWSTNSFVKAPNCNLLSTQGFYNPSLFHLSFKNQVLGIKFLSNSTYTLSSIFYLVNDKMEFNPFAITKVIVKKENTDFVFVDYITEATKDWTEKKAGNIIYHFPADHVFDNKKAIKAADYLHTIDELFDLNPKGKTVNYFIADNCYDVFSISGFEFTPTMNTSEKCAFYDTTNNIIYTSKFYGEFHKHELIHRINTKYPNTHHLLLSGLSIYHKEDNALQNYTFKELFNLLYLYQTTNKNYKLSITNTKNFDPKLSVDYLIGALIVDAIAEKGGIELVKEVLSTAQTDEDLITFIQHHCLQENETIEDWLAKRTRLIIEKSFRFKIML